MSTTAATANLATANHAHAHVAGHVVVHCVFDKVDEGRDTCVDGGELVLHAAEWTGAHDTDDGLAVDEGAAAVTLEKN